MGTVAYPSRAADLRILVFDTLEDVPRAFDKIARIDGCDGLFHSALEAMYAEARAVGADAIVLGPRPVRTCDGLRDEDWSVLAIRWR